MSPSEIGTEERIGPVPGPRPIRALVVTKGLARGGAERLIVDQVRGTDPALVRFTVLYALDRLDDLVDEVEAEKAEVLGLGGSTTLDPAWMRALSHHLKSGRFDLVHAHMPLPAAVCRLLLSHPRHRALPLVYTEHNVWESHHRATRWLNRLTYARNTSVIAVSQEVRRSMPARAQTIAEVLHHGIDIKAIREHKCERDSVRRELGIGALQLVVGTVANLRAQKRLTDLVIAAEVVCEQSPVVRFVIVGSGPEEPTLRRLIVDRGLVGKVMLLGSRPDVPRLLSAFDIFAMSSIHEGMPVAMMEALAMGLPIVATAVGGIPDLVGDDAGSLVPPQQPARLAQALISLSQDAGARKRMMEAAALRAPSFSSEIACRRLGHIYTQLVEVPVRCCLA